MNGHGSEFPIGLEVTEPVPAVSRQGHLSQAWDFAMREMLVVLQLVGVRDRADILWAFLVTVSVTPLGVRTRTEALPHQLPPRELPRVMLIFV